MKKFLLLGLALFIVSLSAQAQYYSTIYAQTARVDSLVPRGTSGQFGWFTRNVSPHTGAVTLITATDTLRIATGYFTGNATIAGLLNGFTLRQGASLSDTAKFALVISNLADTSKYTEYADTTSLLTNQWRLLGKQNVIANLADTSLYAKSTDLIGGTLTIGDGDSVRVNVPGLTTATGVAWATYKTTAAVAADTTVSYGIHVANLLTVYGKFGWKAGWGVIKK